ISEEETTAREAQAEATPRLLGVGADSGLFQDLGRYARVEGEALERVSDAPSALRALSRGGWSVVIVVLDQEPDDQLTWWVDVLRRVPRRPRLVVLVPSPSIGFVLRAWQMGVFDVLPVPLPRERFSEMLQRVKAAEDETPIPLPDLHAATVGPTQMVSGSPSMLPVFRTMA